MKDAGNSQFRLRARGVELRALLENGARFIERPFVQARMREEHEQRKIVRRNGDGLAERIELGHESTLEREGGKVKRANLRVLIGWWRKSGKLYILKIVEKQRCFSALARAVLSQDCSAHQKIP